jgi:hypothetical protein
MTPKSSLKTLLALGLTSSLAYGAEAEFEAKPIETKPQPSSMMEGGCGSNMKMDQKTMVMYENTDTLPKDCQQISQDVTIQVKAGVKYATAYPGTIFGFNEHHWEAPPCSRITVEFTNEDEIRHQWMIHGLPQYLYPQGMFHLEAHGQSSVTGTFIVPSSHYTYLVHCDIAQHMEKGMKAQLKIGNGRGDLPSIPGLTDPAIQDQF